MSRKLSTVELEVKLHSTEYYAGKDVSEPLKEHIKALEENSDSKAIDTLNALRDRLRSDSKGQPETWGFVALFMQMIDDTEKETLKGKPNEQEASSVPTS